MGARDVLRRKAPLGREALTVRLRQWDSQSDAGWPCSEPEGRWSEVRGGRAGPGVRG